MLYYKAILISQAKLHPVKVPTVKKKEASKPANPARSGGDFLRKFSKLVQFYEKFKMHEK